MRTHAECHHPRRSSHGIALPLATWMSLLRCSCAHSQLHSEVILVDKIIVDTGLMLDEIKRRCDQYIRRFCRKFVDRKVIS